MIEADNNSLEWEVLQEPIIIEKIVQNKYIPKNSISIVVNRTDSYQIKAILTAIQENVPLAERDIEYCKHFYKTSPGSRLEPFDIEGKDQHGSKIELKNCYITNISSNEENNSERIVTLNIIVYEMKIENNNDSEVSCLSDWYLNGPNRISFPKETVRFPEDESEKVSRKRVDIDISMDDVLKQDVKKLKLSQIPQISRDCALVTLNNYKFIIAEVPNKFGPTWSKNMCIEYRKEFGQIPDKKTREAISEIVSFVLGTQLLNVGFTEYDNEGQTVACFTKPSWGEAYSRSVCENIQLSPFNLRNEGKIEELLCDLVPKYLNEKDKLGLNEALWRYWISRDAPLGTNLPILSSALELIMNKWFKSENSKSNGFWIPNGYFEDMIKESLSIAEKKIDEYIENKIKSLSIEKRDSLEAQEIEELKNSIMTTIFRSNEMSISKQWIAFFKEIGLESGSVEKKAIKARHAMAHGNKMDIKKLEKMRKCTLAYQTLFHRVFLKVLGYKGNHIDRSVIGFPEKNINLPLGKINRLNVETLSLISK